MEPLKQTTIVPIQDSSQVALARRTATELASAVGLDEQRRSAVNVVTVELANNILQHAGSGQLLFQYIQAIGAFDIMAVDHGAGMVNVERCLEDGFSTRSTPGLGLGAVRRFATRFGAYSIPARTTVVTARMAERNPEPDLSVICTAIHGETLSGDAWAVSEDGRSFCVVDGLGHGMLAADAAKVAVEIFRKHPGASPASILERMHAAMRSTRGAAGALARINPEAGTLDFAGIGNISCVLLRDGKSQNLVSHNGTLGHQLRRIQEFSYPYSRRDLLLMHSDGLTTHAKLGIPSSLLVQAPNVIAPFLFSEQLRGRDDATLLVNRLG
jgi:anti-sigma regulatory factor (Ser/Thr protein kinase)